MVSGVARIFFEKNWNLVWFYEPNKKINWNFPATPLGPSAGEESGAKRRTKAWAQVPRPCDVPEIFQKKILEFHEYNARF